jgi:hypothetical protein
MNPSTPTIQQRVRFEEVTPANEYAVYFDTSLDSVLAHCDVPIFEGYDDLDDMRFAFLTLPTGETVTIGEYLHDPLSGSSLYVDIKMQNIPQIVFEACQSLQVSRKKIIWFHADWEKEINHLYAKYGDTSNSKTPVQKTISTQKQQEPIDCFHHALSIYTHLNFPEYWAMLQHNLGLAYHDRSQGDRRENLERSIVSFHNALQIHTHQEFPEKWKIDQDDLAKSRAALELLGNQKILQKS